MPAETFVQCRVSSEMKTLIRELAAQESVTESALVRSLLETLFRTSQPPAVAPVAHPARAHRPHRLFVRVAEEDWVLLDARALERGLAPSTYAAVLLHAHLRSINPIPKAELLALKELIGELGAIGRNLNQIARVASTGGSVPGPGARQTAALLKVSAGLRDHVRSLLIANELSWRTGYAKDEA